MFPWNSRFEPATKVSLLPSQFRSPSFLSPNQLLVSAPPSQVLVACAWERQVAASVAANAVIRKVEHRDFTPGGPGQTAVSVSLTPALSPRNRNGLKGPIRCTRADLTENLTEGYMRQGRETLEPGEWLGCGKIVKNPTTASLFVASGYAGLNPLRRSVTMEKFAICSLAESFRTSCPTFAPPSPMMWTPAEIALDAFKSSLPS